MGCYRNSPYLVRPEVPHNDDVELEDRMLREEEFLSPLGRRQVRQELQVRLKVRESSFSYLCSQLGLKESESQRAAWCRGALKARLRQATAAHSASTFQHVGCGGRRGSLGPAWAAKGDPDPKEGDRIYIWILSGLNIFL